MKCRLQADFRLICVDEASDDVIPTLPARLRRRIKRIRPAALKGLAGATRSQDNSRRDCG